MSSIEQLDIEPATLFCPLRSSRDEEEFQWSSESAGARDDGVRQLQTDPMRVEGNIKDGITQRSTSRGRRCDSRVQCLD